ncbi:MAG: TrkA family potassium uptake protein [Anaerolineales bacterium]
MRIIVIGCGRMGSGVALALQARQHTVTVVDRDASSFERLGPGFRGKTVLGVGFDQKALIEAGIERADALAAMMPSDEANVVAARLASEFYHVPRVVVRLYDPRKAEVYTRLGLMTVSPMMWGTHRAADMLSYAQMDTVVSLGVGGVDIVDVQVPVQWQGQTVQTVTVPASILVVAISRGGKAFLPTLGTVFQAGDVAHIALVPEAADRLRALLGSA